MSFMKPDIGQHRRLGMQSIADMRFGNGMPPAEGYGATPSPPPLDPLCPTIYHEPWWLDVVTDGRIEFVESREHGRIVGRLPFLQQSRLNFRSSNMPPFTHFLGPAVDHGRVAAKNRLLRQIEVTGDLIRQLPRMASFRQKMHRGINNVIAFQSAQFDASAQFTFEIRPEESSLIWRNMRDKTRNVIRTGEKTFSVDGSMDPETFIDFYKGNLRERAMTQNVDMELCQRLIEQCLRRGCGRFWVARNDAGVAKAAIFCVWDNAACYYLLSSRTLDSGNGAVALLIWSAIRHAAFSGKIFDFDGLGSVGSIMFYSGFGGVVSPRYIVSRSNLSYRFLRGIRRIVEPVHNPFC
jgi:hypothetical protein